MTEYERGFKDGYQFVINAMNKGLKEAQEETVTVIERYTKDSDGNTQKATFIKED